MNTKLLLLIMMFTFASQAQNTWQWGKRGGSTSTRPNGTHFKEPILDMATDPNGNVYMIANVGGENLVVDGTTLNFHFGADNFGNIEKYTPGGLLMSYDCDGNFRWSKLISGSYEGVVGVETDTLGHIYLLAYTIGHAKKDVFGTEYPVYFDSDTLIPYSNNPKKYKQTNFLVQYDTLGNMKRFHSPDSDSIHILSSGKTTRLSDVIVDPNGTQHYPLFAKNYQNSGLHLPVVEGDTLLPGTHIIKYDVQGNYLGNIKLEMELSNENGVGLLPKINHDPVRKAYYMSGWNQTPHTVNYQDSLWVGGQLVDSPMFVAKFDSLGNSKWLKQGQPDMIQSNVFYQNPQIDQQGNIYLGGNFQHTQSNQVSFNGYVPQHNTLSAFPVIIKMDSKGNLLWGNSANGVDAGSVRNNIKYSSNNISYVNSHAGIQWGSYGFPQDPNSGYGMYHARFNAQTGAIISMDTIGSNFGYSEYPTAITADKRGNVYIGGEFQGQMYVGQDTLTNTHSSYQGTDYFLVKAGQANCNCTLPEAGFSYTGSNGTVNFTYTGTGYDSLEWGFDDGTVQTGTANSIGHTYTEDEEYWVCVTAYNSCGYDTWCTLVEPFALATPTLTAASFGFYPNPVKEDLTIDAQENLNYRLYDITGKLIKKGSLAQGENQISTSSLPSGFYML